MAELHWGRSITVAAVASLLLVTGACATKPKDEYRMLPTGENGVGVRFSRGNAAMISSGRNGSVMLLPVRYNSSNRLYFSVSALNRSGVPINFGTEDVSLWVDGQTRVRVQDFNILRQQMRWQAQREMDSAWVDAALDGYLAYENAKYHPNRSQIAYQTAAGSFAFSHAVIEGRLHRSITDMGRRVLQTSTIDPGYAHAGWVYADQLAVPDYEVRKLTIAVNLGGEEHLFGIDLAASQNEVGVARNIPAVPRIDFARVAGAAETYNWTDPQRPAPRYPVVIE